MIGLLHPLQVAAHPRALVVAAVHVQEAGEQAQQDHRQQAGHHRRHHPRGSRVQGVGGAVSVRAVPPFGVSALGAVAGGRVGDVTLVVVPGLAQPVSTVAAVARALAPRAVEGGVLARARAVGAAFLRDAGGQRAEDGDGARVDEKVLDVDLVVQVELGVVE